jgi:hypothetical protein
MARMTMGQWRSRLGDAVELEHAPRTFGLTSMQVLRAVKTGKVPLHTFKASDGRVFRMIKTRDLQAYQSQNAAAVQQALPTKPAATTTPAITMDGMKAAFREMAKS